MAIQLARFLAASFAFPFAASAATFAGIEVPPPPAPKPVVDTHWGVKVEDPYRYMEDTKDPEVQKYMRGQADASTAILAKIPGRERLLARIKEIDAATPAVVSSVRRDGRGGYFFLKRDAHENQLKLYWREKPGAQDKLLVDPEAESKAKGSPQAIGGFTPSRDGRLMAYSMYGGGGEIGELRVIEVATGKPAMPAIDRIRGSGSVNWLEDGSGFFYSRLAEGYDKRPRAERFLDNVNYLRRLADPTRDVPVFGPKLHPEVDIERSSSGAVFEVHGQPYAAAVVSHGVDRSRSFYLAKLDDVLAGKPMWRMLVDRPDQVSSMVPAGDKLYLISRKDAPRHRLLRVKLSDTDLGKAEVVIPASDAVVTEIGNARDALYVTRREGVVKKIYRIAHREGAKPEPVGLPLDGEADLLDVNPRYEGAVLRLGSWTRATKHYFLAADAARPVPMELAPPGKFDAPAGITAREVMVKSHDGVEIPLSIISRTDIKLDGSNPATVYGYGAYGIVQDPSWSPRLLAWLEAGGVFVVAHVRGGGIFGDGWAKAAWKTTKFNTWKDGIAAAEWLVANGYTSREKLSIYGGSAGGIFVGRAITERPDLFSVGVIAVGNTDQVRSETRANGVGNIPEYGTVTKEDEFRALLANSTYANVKPATKYPAVLLEHGVNDSRVDVWMTLKTGSRFAAATTSGKPVLMRLEFDAGHGPGATRDQAQLRTADRYAFLLWQAGVKDFQP